MKRVLALFLVLICMLSLVACDKATGSGEPVRGGDVSDMPEIDKNVFDETEQTQQAIVGSISGGESDVYENGKATFQVTILEIRDGNYLVEPVDGSTELNIADQITVPMTNKNLSPEPEVGDVLEIEYDGSIAESFPTQITNVYSIRIVE